MKLDTGQGDNTKPMGGGQNDGRNSIQKEESKQLISKT
jgi:hypothetical protein